MQLCQSCGETFEPKEWIYVGSALWARCRFCFATFEVGHLEPATREQVGPSDAELELQLWSRRGSSPPLSRVCVKKLAESMARLRLKRLASA